MASDNFTNSDGTGLESHNAAWTSIDGTYVVTTIEINNNLIETETTWQYGGAYYSGSGEDDSQIVFVGGTTFTERHVAVRIGSGSRGYSVALTNVSAPNFTRLYAYKNGNYLANLGTISAATADDHTVRVTASGTSTVTIEGYVDGSSIGTTADSTSPIGAGDPGFWYPWSGAIANTRFDDWTDNAAAPTGSPWYYYAQQ